MMIPINGQIPSSSALYRLLLLSSSKMNIVKNQVHRSSSSILRRTLSPLPVLSSKSSSSPRILSPGVLRFVSSSRTNGILSASLSTVPLLKLTASLQSRRVSFLKRARTSINSSSSYVPLSSSSSPPLSAKEIVQLWTRWFRSSPSLVSSPLSSSTTATIPLRFTSTSTSNTTHTVSSSSSSSSSDAANTRTTSPSSSSVSKTEEKGPSVTAVSSSFSIIDWFRKNKQEMKFLFQTFGYFTVASYLGVYTVTLSTIYGLISTGILTGPDPTEWINNFWLKKAYMGDEVLQLPTWSINFATAWVLTKLTEPVRLVTTIALVPYTAKRLPISFLQFFGVKPESLEIYRKMHPKRSDTIIAKTSSSNGGTGTDTSSKV